MSIEKLKEYDRLYTLGNPIISDLEYDNFRDEMFEKDPNNSYFQSVGVDLKDKVKLPFILGSLKKTKIKKDDEIIGSAIRWVDKQNDDVITTPKLDGVSILVNYCNGIVVSAYTRGDGEYGRLITNKARKFIKPIKEQKSIWVRGEVQLNFLPEEYKNKRNATAGILNDDKDNKYHSKLTVLFYEYVNGDHIDTEKERLEKLEEYGIPVVKSYILTQNTTNETILINVLTTFKEMYYNLDCDGIVLTKNNSKRENVKLPDHKVAFKVNQEGVKTKVKDIEFNTSKNGKIKPVIIIEPIIIDGVTINRVTGHNINNMVDKNIGIGTTITVIRSGDVIPFLVDVFDDGMDFILPKKCPSCDSILVLDGVDMACMDEYCEAQGVKSLAFFIKTIDVMGMSEKTLEKLNVSSIKELYSLTYDDIIKCDGFGHKKSEKIIDELTKSLNVEDYKLLASFGVSGLGKTTSKTILKEMSFKEAWENEDFSFINGIGQITSDKIVEGLLNHREDLKFLKSRGLNIIEKENIEMIESDFSNKTVTLTGKAPIKRTELIKKLENVGCVVKNISKKIDFLITDDVESNSGKAKKARNFDIPFMSYDELLKRI